MGVQRSGRTGGIFEVETDREREIYVSPPLFAEKGPEKRRGLLKPIYVLATTCRERHDALKFPPTDKLGGKATLLGKSVLLWGDKQFQYGFAECLRDKCIGRVM